MATINILISIIFKKGANKRYPKNKKKKRKRKKNILLIVEGLKITAYIALIFRFFLTSPQQMQKSQLQLQKLS